MFKAILTGPQKLARRLRHIRETIPVIVSKERLGSFMLRRIRERFLRQVDPDRVPWPKLAPKSKKGVQILFRHGYLYRGIDVVSSDEFGTATGLGFRIGVKERSIEERYKKTVRIVKLTKYARVHQYGAGNIPKRRFLGISSLDRRAVGAMLYRDFKKAVRQSA